MVNIGIQFVVVREAWHRQDATSTDSKPFTLIEVITVSNT